MNDATNDLFAELLFDENGMPKSKIFEDIYFSTNNGLKETRHVFLNGNDLTARFKELSNAENTIHPTFTIGETGFGSGLNFLASWALFDKIAPENTHLHFISVEKHPLRPEDLIKTLSLWPELDSYAERLIKIYPLITGQEIYRLSLANNISLTLIINDAAEGLQQLYNTPHPSISMRKTSVDAWFLDGFSPAKNPAMWTDALFSTIKSLSHNTTTLSTFSAAALVKNGLKKVGFTLKKIPGYRKRDMLTAYLENSASTSPHAASSKIYKHAIILGAGIAGCHSAHALAKRGWKVTVIEKNKLPAAEGSGNPQAVVYVRLSHRRELLSRFNMVCLQYAQNAYGSFWKKHEGNNAAGQQSGVLQLENNLKKMQLYPKIIESIGIENDVVEYVTAKQASHYSGTKLQSNGMYFPKSGWINPAMLCQDLLNHKNIHVKTDCTVSHINYTDEQWQLLDHTQAILAKTTTLIIANAAAASSFEQLSFLPLKAIRGQVSYLTATPESKQLTTTLCGEGYLAPESLGQHCLGATFNLHETTPELMPLDHQQNLQLLKEFGPDTEKLFNEACNLNLTGRVGFRCSTPDYLPVVGQAPVFEGFLKDFAYLRKTAKAPEEITPQYWPGLYVNCGFGSRGLAYTPLCAELLASTINQEPLPISADLANAVNPSRFIIRDLARNKL